MHILSHRLKKEIFYLKKHSTIGVGHMVKILFPISSKGSFIYTIPVRIAHTMAFVTPVVEHWLEQEIAQWVHHEGSI